MRENNRTRGSQGSTRKVHARLNATTDKAGSDKEADKNVDTARSGLDSCVNDPIVGSEIHSTRPRVLVSTDDMNAHLRTVIAV